MFHTHICDFKFYIAVYCRGMWNYHKLSPYLNVSHTIVSFPKATQQYLATTWHVFIPKQIPKKWSFLCWAKQLRRSRQNPLRPKPTEWRRRPLRWESQGGRSNATTQNWPQNKLREYEGKKKGNSFSAVFKRGWNAFQSCPHPSIHNHDMHMLPKKKS